MTNAKLSAPFVSLPCVFERAIDMIVGSIDTELTKKRGNQPSLYA